MSDIIKNGRPFKYTDPSVLQQEIKTYFAMCDPHTEDQLRSVGDDNHGEPIFRTKKILTKQRPYTVSGLALALGVSRTTLNDYRNPEHFGDNMDPEVVQGLMDSINDAVGRIEAFNEEQLHTSGLANGVKFNLVNNFSGWADKKVVDNNNHDVEAELNALEKQAEAKAARNEMAAEAKKAMDEVPQPEADNGETVPRPATEE